MAREPFIAHSELTNEIYIVVGKEKYRVTEQAIKAVMAIKALEQEPIDYKAQYERFSKKADIVISQLRADRDRLMSLTSVRPQEPKTGHWIDREVYDADRWKCSECGRTEQYKENYCPNCGADMREVVEE